MRKTISLNFNTCIFKELPFALLMDTTNARRSGNCSRLNLNDTSPSIMDRVQTERDGTRAETRFGLPAKRTSPFISAGVSVQSSTGFLGVRVGGERL